MGTVSEDIEYDVFSSSCPSRPVLEDVTGRWGALALGALADGPLRFNELRRQVDGVSQKMLAQSLHALERDGLVHRDVQSTFPLKVEYSLTPTGAVLAAKLLDLIGYLTTSMPGILAAQQTYDEARAD
ncbi:helix-turn-helix transcriptional regulator [Kribbella sandramycini]|uniref:Helix-turn-helix transcriptional regulator n=1 Tax=Kribbella sandramycini TaxID=60450 RepID=A0A7Y4NZC2_9ACTN|nr:helix-turn-helix domain-containing protein [Kribbella sandramycini]NOL41451.1 helix-turn-helix transcriptional regulator [Kribbella sandramycini]